MTSENEPSERADRVWPLVRQAVERGAIPGAVFGVTDGVTRAVRHAGAAQIVPERRPLTAETWFDLASLTKVLFTTPAILRAAADGALDLDAPLAAVIPDLRQYDRAAPERALTARQCLTHQTHLPAVEPIYTYGRDPSTLRAFVLQREWRPGPAVYSDINFILLGIALERLSGRMLGEHALPPGLAFHPSAEACAATEFCTWRGRVMRGAVHDENAYALGGAAGHAGLFGTMTGVLDQADALLRGDPPSADLRRRQTPTRALGWEMRHDGWPGGDTCSDETIGHTGFTGTGLWIDFAAGRAWALLTNRVHPSRHVETGIASLRRQVGDAVSR